MTLDYGNNGKFLIMANAGLIPSTVSYCFVEVRMDALASRAQEPEFAWDAMGVNGV